MPTHNYMKSEPTLRPLNVAAATPLRRTFKGASVARYVEYTLIAITASAAAWFVFELTRYLSTS